jgi:hypothetical protein
MSDSPRLGYRFFRSKALSGELFTIAEVTAATGWSAATFTTYLPKQWKGLVEKARSKPTQYRVCREFLRLGEREFLNHITQNRPLFGEYERTFHDHIITFEFLLPLTRETELRRALDALFFADTIEQRLREIGLDELHHIVARDPGAKDEEFLTSLISQAERFGGYSISHVSGRFRTTNLMSRSAAAQLIADSANYLVDETTAIVRFIVPCRTGEGTFDDALYSLTNLGTPTCLRKHNWRPKWN